MVELKIQKRIAAQLLKCSQKRVIFDTERLSDIKEAITKNDLKTLINEKAIQKKPVKGISRVRARYTQKQRTKGRKRGYGKRKGSANAREPKKRNWINKVRVQRASLKQLRDKDYITKNIYRKLYGKVKSGFFRSKKHLKMYIEENKLITKTAKKQAKL